MNISVVVPAYNDEKTIVKNVKIILDFVKSDFKNYEVIVVDDGSNDKTSEFLKKIDNDNLKVLINKKNMGKGHSVKKGMQKAKYEYILFSDADLATPITELAKLIKYIPDFDVVMASRNMKHSKIITKQPFLRQLMGKSFALLVNLFVVQGFKDTQCGFKLFKKYAAKKITSLQKMDKWSFDVEMILIAKKNGYKVKEVPVKWIDRAESRLNPLHDSLRMLFDIFKIIRNSLTGKYG